MPNPLDALRCFSMATRKMSTEERARIFKALSDPKRVQLLDLVAEHGSLSGTDLAKMMGISLALVSHHWEILADAGLLEKTRVGQTRYCTAQIACLGEALACFKELEPAPPEKKRAPARPKKKKSA